MWGLIRKDFYVNRKEIGIYSALAGGCSVFLMIPFGAGTMEELGLLYSLIGAIWLIGIFILIGTLENGLLLPDEDCGYEQFVLSSPLGVKGQVLSKYYICLAISLAGAFWCILLAQVSVAVTGVENGLTLVVVLLFYLQIFLRAVELPFLFGLGARYGNYVKMGAALILLFLSLNHMLYGKGRLFRSFEEVLDWLGNFSVEQLADGAVLALGLAMLGSLALFYGSYYLSCLWYRRRMRQ